MGLEVQRGEGAVDPGKVGDAGTVESVEEIGR
jgi:hypothetical protein